MHTIFRFLLIITVAFSGLFFKDDIYSLIHSKNVPESSDVSAATDTMKVLGAMVSNSEAVYKTPVKVSTDLLDSKEESFLNPEAVIKYINLEREKENLSDLKYNQKLNQSAEIKLNDMINKEYFDHVSPDKIIINDLGARVGYSYIIMGENLAYGDFKNNKALVQAWMDSQAHRSNILNSRYTETGIALKKAEFQGKETWIIVQHFGEPLAKCQEVDLGLKQTIDDKKAQLTQISQKLNLADRGVASALMAYIVDRNEIKEYTALAKETENLINEYNKQVSVFNECINS